MSALLLQFPQIAVTSVPHKPSKTFLKYQKLIKSKRWTENEIKGFCWALNGVKKVDLTDEQRAELLQSFRSVGSYRISREQTKFGINWLRETCFKKNGEERDSKKSNCFGYREKKIIKNFSRFELVDLYNNRDAYNSYYSSYKSYSAVYRVISKDGSYFDYTIPGLWAEPIIF
jgi:hypothetical protein